MRFRRRKASVTESRGQELPEHTPTTDTTEVNLAAAKNIWLLEDRFRAELQALGCLSGERPGP